MRPTTEMSMPDGCHWTAQRRIAPAAIRKREAPIVMLCCSVPVGCGHGAGRRGRISICGMNEIQRLLIARSL